MGDIVLNEIFMSSYQDKSKISAEFCTFELLMRVRHK